MVKLNSPRPNGGQARVKMTLLKELRLADECSENCENGRRSSLNLLLIPDLVSTLLATSKYKDTGGLFRTNGYERVSCSIR